jgi:MATE family multidrug resistance protein
MRSVLQVSLPLMLSMAAVTVMEFTDRIFLSNYDLNAIAAAMPAGILAFLFILLFANVAAYVNVFIAQYLGAGQPEKVGPVVWQGFYFSLLAWGCLALLGGCGPWIFDWVGHPRAIRDFEVIYFRILCLGAGPHVAASCCAGFFAGLGRTRPIFVVNLIGMLVNIPLDYALIYGRGPFPELGITGAAIATVSSWALIFLLFTILMAHPSWERAYALRRAWAFRLNIGQRLLRYGLPSAAQMFLDVLAFTVFVLMVGRIGREALAVTNILLSINSLTFTPSMGFSVGASTLVGRALGGGRVDEALAAVDATRHLLLAYTAILAALFVLLPERILGLFIPAEAGAAYATVLGHGRTLLRLMAVYILFDCQYMTYVGALKGAGDTHFIMGSIALGALGCMIAPVMIGVLFFNAGLYFCWGCAALFIMVLFGLTRWRYRQGRWQQMRVIDTHVIDTHVIDTGVSGTPA